MNKTFTGYSGEKIDKIHALSKEHNTGDKNHLDILLKKIHEHVQEITELASSKDPHAAVETGDLIVLCLELLKEMNKSPDVVLDECYGRFIKKLEGARCVCSERGGVTEV